VNIKQASAELAVLNHQYDVAHPGMLDSKLGSTERVTRLRDQLVADVRSVLWMLLGAVSFVLLIACANVASLLLAYLRRRRQSHAGSLYRSPSAKDKMFPPDATATCCRPFTM
jgi:putative ABC transport system permease protein